MTTTKAQSTTEPLEPCPWCKAMPEQTDLAPSQRYRITHEPTCFLIGRLSDPQGREGRAHYIPLREVPVWNSARRSPASAAPVVDEGWVKLLATAISTAGPTLMPERDGLTYYVIAPEAFAGLVQVHRAIAQKLWGAAATAAPVQLDTRPSCWHCGVVLAYTPKLRCEDCPDECDIEGCDELGCAIAAAAPAAPVEQSDAGPSPVGDAAPQI